MVKREVIFYSFYFYMLLFLSWCCPNVVLYDGQHCWLVIKSHEPGGKRTRCSKQATSRATTGKMSKERVFVKHLYLRIAMHATS